MMRNIFRRGYVYPPRLAIYRLHTLRFSTATQDQAVNFKRVFKGIAITSAIVAPPIFTWYLLKRNKDASLEEVVDWRMKGALRVDVGQVGSNFPSEDMICYESFSSPSTPHFSLIALFDGHNGKDLSYYLSKHLPDRLIESMKSLFSQSLPRPASGEIDNTIKRVFVDLDNEIVHQSLQSVLGIDPQSYNASRFDAVNALRLADAGSCALVGMYETKDRSLRLALTGDLRAVLGRRVQAPENTAKAGQYVYQVEALTVDQNAHNLVEAARLSEDHPDEPDLLKNKRVLGWGPSRAFGDGIMKWSRQVRENIHGKYLNTWPKDNYKTPPYFTAEPVITVKEGIQKGDFVVFASDGLWDCLESEEVVGLVGQWLEENGKKEVVQRSGSTELTEITVPPSPTATTSKPAESTSGKILGPSELPVIYPEGYQDSTNMYKWWRAEKKFVFQDDNSRNSVAMHLIRNALGGADADLRAALLSLNPPKSRKYRDDISVVVVFFE